jgi:threonine dehydratase
MLPTIADAQQARRLLAQHLQPTPLVHYPTLGVRIKHENLQPTGAFKVRGGLTLLAALSRSDLDRGVLGYSTGNHAQSLAYAAAQYGAPCTIVMPKNPNPAKANAVRALGAELIEFGANFDEARAHATDLARTQGMRLVSAANEPEIIAGVATAYLEILEQAPDAEIIVVPVGSGTGAAAACLVAARQCEIIAVQSAASPAAHDSWRAGHLVERPNHTAAEGLATGIGFELTQEILRAHLKDFLLVDDADIRRAQQILRRDASTVAEGAGAAAFAAVLTHPERFAGRDVVVMCSGGNVSE